MTFLSRIVIFVLWIVSLVTIGALVSAQTRPTAPAIISGADIGFRPDAAQPSHDRVRGTLVVRLNGQWVDAQFSTRQLPVVK